MNKSLSFLESILFNNKNDPEILPLAQHLRRISDTVREIFNSYTLYDLSVMEGDQLNHVVVQAYRKLDSINSLVEKLG